MKKLKIIVVDDHKIIRDGIRAMLLGNKEVEIIGEASKARSLFEILKQNTPDIILLDIKLEGGMSGIDIAKNLTRENYPSKILMLSANIDENYIIASLKAGAKGFLSKDCSREELLNAINALRLNQVFFGENISQKVITSYVRQVQGNIEDMDKPLSDREMEIAKLLCEGLSARQIGEELCISPRTAEAHKNNILGKLGLQNTVELVKYAIREEWIEV